MGPYENVSSGPAVPFDGFAGRGKKAISESGYSYTRYGDAAISNARFNARIRYGNLAHVSNGACGNFAFITAAKPLQKKDIITTDSL